MSFPPLLWSNEVPDPSETRVALHVTPSAERALRGGHPWIFAEAISKQSREGAPGDLAVVFDRKDRFLAVGLYDPTSAIRVRILQHGQPETINLEWLSRKIETAAQLRSPLVSEQTNAIRLVHGENDGLPGLVIDQYDTTYVAKLDTVAWIRWLDRVVSVLERTLQPERIVLRLSRSAAAEEISLFGLTDGSVLAGNPVEGPIRFQENGLRFEADVVRGHKTGFYLDQRENRLRVEAIATGRKVLNLFSYTGGFSLYAARGGANEIVSSDISRPALQGALRNFSLNGDLSRVAAARHSVVQGDAFDVLQELAEKREDFDIVVVDPPSFAVRQRQVTRALSAYRRLVQLGLTVLRSGGMLVIFSCSSRIAADQFFDLVHDEASATGRPLRELERTGHPADHPIGYPEGEYLKGLFAIAP